MRTRCGLRNPLRLRNLCRVFLRKYLRLNHLTCFWFSLLKPRWTRQMTANAWAYTTEYSEEPSFGFTP